MSANSQKQTFVGTLEHQNQAERDGFLLAVERWYNFPEFGGYLGNVGLIKIAHFPALARHQEQEYADDHQLLPGHHQWPGFHH